MSGNEGMRPHELASQMLRGDYEINNGRVESVRLASLIDRSEEVWRQLAKGHFEEDENGYASIGIEDWSSDFRSSASSDNVDALQVYYTDPKGNVMPLGRVARLQSYSHKATAYVAEGDGKYQPVLPGDARWNAVVGVVERAVDACIEEKQKKGHR